MMNGQVVVLMMLVGVQLCCLNSLYSGFPELLVWPILVPETILFLNCLIYTADETILLLDCLVYRDLEAILSLDHLLHKDIQSHPGRL